MVSSSTKSTTFGVAVTASALAIASTAAALFLYHKQQQSESIAKKNPKEPTLRIYENKEQVAIHLSRTVVQAAQLSIAERGVFYWAVAGGSLLDILSSQLPTIAATEATLDWSKVVLVFANHKCIDPTDAKATMAKCQSLFGNALGITRYVVPSSSCPVPSSSSNTSDGTTEAAYYTQAMVQANIPFRGPYPVLDMILLGLGEDGHVGSNHPMSSAVLETSKAVVGSPKQGEPSSITLTIESMNAARNTIVVVCGGSQGKKEAVHRAIQRPPESPRGIFPAQLLDGPVFFLEADAAAAL